MENMEDKIGSILSNPEMMAQIMKMAQALGQNQQAPPPPPKQPPIQSGSSGGKMSADPDFSMIQKIASLSRQAGIDKNQQNLLQALRPYLGYSQIQKLEKAMRAAKIASFAATALGNSGN